MTDQRAETNAERAATGLDPIAWDREETDTCQRSTQGCSVDHRTDSECETW